MQAEDWNPTSNNQRVGPTKKQQEIIELPDEIFEALGGGAGGRW
jgi:hypothetical protein